MNIYAELIVILWHALRYGDLRGHLRAFFRVVTGDVTPETRYILTVKHE